MAVTNAAQAATKTVSDPNAAYESLVSLWTKSRAVCGGERFVKDLDTIVNAGNLLVPFSPTMTQDQYAFYKAEAELPGIVSQFAKMIVGGLLRKQPVIKLPEDMDDALKEEALNWINNEFGQDDQPLSGFLDNALWEELQTSRAWVFIDYPNVTNPDSLSDEQRAALKPYPVLMKAESVINWQIGTNDLGKKILKRVITRGVEEVFDSDDQFHPKLFDTVRVHELDASGFYQIRVFRSSAEASAVPVVSGKVMPKIKTESLKFDEQTPITNILMNDERLDFIPAWPLNGSIEPGEPILIPIIDKEVSLYNKMSRRNHLLYGAATYTPIISSDMSDDEFRDVVSGGLGTWIHLKKDESATVLPTPTAALADMDRAIAAGIEEMARMGIRMLSPETAQSGIALQIRNAAQTAQLGTLNTKVSNVLRQVIVVMLNWRYDLGLTVNDVEFNLSTDFNPVQNGTDWLRLATEWYQGGLIPRSAWLIMLKQNDLLPPDYDDIEGREEITKDLDLAMKASGSTEFNNGIENP